MKQNVEDLLSPGLWLALPSEMLGALGKHGLPWQPACFYSF